MPTYRFTALNESGHKITGEREAPDEATLDRQLRQVGLDLLSFKEEGYGRGLGLRRISWDELMVFCVQMFHLTRAGITVMEAVDGAQQSLGAGKLRSVLVGVYDRLRQGDGIAQAFAQYPNIFNRFFIAMVAVGEKTGKTPFVFNELAEHLRRIISLRRMVIKAVRYPLISMFFTSGLIFLFIAYGLSYAINHTVHLPADWLKYIPVSSLLLHYWPQVLLLPPLIGWLTVKLYKLSEAFARIADEIMLKIPYLESILIRADLARFTRIFAMLFNAGVDVLQSVDTAANTMSNRVLRDEVLAMKRYIERGLTLHESVRMCGCFPPMVIQAFHNGETTGQMAEAFEKVNYFYVQQVNDAVESLIGMLRPALMVIAGALLL